MAYDGSVKIDSSIDGSGMAEGLEKLGSVAKKTMAVLAGLIGGVATALGTTAVAGVKYNSQMEQYITSFGTMLGGADKASSLVADLKKFAADTPFEFSDLAKGTQTLLAFGVSSNDVMSDLKMLGDVSQGNTERFDALALAFGQISSAGKMQGQDLLQLINAGFNPLQVMAQKTGKSMSELRAEMENGQISAKDVADAFKTATSAGGQFYNAMEAQSKTFSGQLSTLKDNAMQFLGDLTAGLQENLKDTALPMVNGWMDQLQAAFKSGGANGVVAAFGGVLAQAVTAMANATPQLVNMAVTLIQSFIGGLSQNTAQIANAAVNIVGALANGIVILLPQILNLAIKIVLALANGLTQHADQIVSGASQLIGALVSALIQAAPQLVDAAVKLAQAFFTALDQQHPVGTPLVTSVVAAIGAFKGFGAFSSGVKSLADFSNKINDIKNPLKDLQSNFGLIGKNTGAFGSKLKGIGGNVTDLAKNIGGGLLSGVKTLGSGISKLFSILAANPYVLVIGLIIAAVAALIILWNTNAGFRNAVTGAWNAIASTAQSVWGGIINFFTKAIPGFINSVILWFQNLPYNIGLLLGTIVGSVLRFGASMLAWVTTVLPGIIAGIINWFAQLPGNIWNWLVNVVASIGAWGVNMAQTAAVAIPALISSIGNWFAQLPGRIWNAIVGAVSMLANWGGQMFSTAQNAVSSIVNGIIGFFSNLPNDIQNIGANIVNGLWNGITGAWHVITNGVKSLTDGFVSGMKKALGIHSPSRVLRDQIGKMLPPGIAVGFEDAVPDATARMQQQLKAMTAKMQATVIAQQTVVAQGMASGYPVTQTIDNSTTKAPNVTVTGPVYFTDVGRKRANLQQLDILAGY